MVTPWGNKGVAWRKRSCEEQCQMHEGEEDHARPWWTTSRRGQDSPWKSQSEWQKTEINGDSTRMSMVWPTFRSRMAKEQNLTEPRWTGTRKVNQSGFYWSKRQQLQWHQLGHMQVCISLQTDNHASTPPLSFLQVGCPSCHPTNSVKALKAHMCVTTTQC